MYNPQGDDYDFEFIELYAENENVSGYYFEGIDFSFPENTTVSGYFVIANTLNDSGPDNDFLDRYGNSSGCCFEYGGALSNSGEAISLFGKNGDVVDSVNYTNTAGEGYSLERTLSGLVASTEKGGTPGFENTHSFSYNSSDNEPKNDSNENESDENEPDNNFCDSSIEIQLPKTSYQNKEQIAITHVLHNITDSYTIEYWIDDFFNNTVKAKQNTTNTNIKHYTPSIQEKEKIIVVKAKLYVECNDTNLSNNYDEKTVFVFNPNYKEVEENEEQTEETKKPETKTAKRPEISSFYTLTKAFTENKTIKLFAYAKNPDKSAGFSTVLLQNNNTIERQDFVIENDSFQKLVFNVTLAEGSNNFSLKLYQNFILYDSAKLGLTALPAENTSLIKPAKHEEKFINNTQELELNSNETELKKEASGSKSNLASYIILAISVALNTILIWRR